MRVKHVKKARKAQGNCTRCRAPIEVGSAYRWIKRRGGPRINRCMEAACAFTNSDLTSGKVSDAWSAIETAQAEIAEADSEQECMDALASCAESLREVAEEYAESASNIREHFSESATADECEEKAEELESFASDLDGWTPEHDESSSIEEVREQASAALDDFPF